MTDTGSSAAAVRPPRPGWTTATSALPAGTGQGVVAAAVVELAQRAEPVEHPPRADRPLPRTYGINALAAWADRHDAVIVNVQRQPGASAYLNDSENSMSRAFSLPSRPITAMRRVS